MSAFTDAMADLERALEELDGELTAWARDTFEPRRQTVRAVADRAREAYRAEVTAAGPDITVVPFRLPGDYGEIPTTRGLEFLRLSEALARYAGGSR